MEAVWYSSGQDGVLMVTREKYQERTYLVFWYQTNDGQWVERDVGLVYEGGGSNNGVKFIGWSHWTGDALIGVTVGNELEWTYISSWGEVTFRTQFDPTVL
jgi:hypothetical protein